ncbi:gustatory and odorant receptor 24-like [Cryptotermes secundus]|uniref:gustatory and odorant receptor 24-like n=1 Tax=Cryptotermes secundus TaxID=105785 RepID=UPI001454CB82|nr:gustatory and odorant receptor 24-like [Cryptotermes secundus]
MEYPDQARGFPRYRPPGQTTEVFYVPLAVRTPRHRASCPSEWKAENDALTLYEEMKPVMIVLRVLGVLPYGVTSTGDVYFKWLSVAMFYSFVLISTVTALVGFNLVERINMDSTTVYTFADKTIEYAGRLFISSVFIIPICHWLETGKKIKFLNTWTQLQAEYRLMSGRQLRLGVRGKVILILPISAVLVAALTMMAYQRGFVAQWWHIIGIAFASSMSVILPFIWVITCSVIIKVATALADDMEQHFSSRGSARGIKISTYRTFWLHLRQLTQDLGNATGFTYGSHTLLFCTISVLVTYGFIVELKDNFNFVFFAASLLFQAIIYSECDCAQNAANQVGAKFSERLQAITNNMPVTCCEGVHEVGNESSYSEIYFVLFVATAVRASTHASNSVFQMRNFLALVRRNPPVISYCGFVNVNRALMTSYFSTTLTYLAVLMQFQVSQRSPEEKRYCA